MDTNITESFIAMVEAYKVKPELEAQVKQLGDDNAMCYRTIDDLRFTIDDRDYAIAELRTKLSEVTTQRDDAMFRNLELEEKLGGIERLLGLAERVESARKAEHEATVAAMTPVKVEPEPVRELEPHEYPTFTGPIDPVVIEPQGQSDENPTVSPTAIETPTTTSKDGPETQTASELSFDQYETITWNGMPYNFKPWWVKDHEWTSQGGLLESQDEVIF